MLVQDVLIAVSFSALFFVMILYSLSRCFLAEDHQEHDSVSIVPEQIPDHVELVVPQTVQYKNSSQIIETCPDNAQIQEII